jgi:hypothetical protein
LILACIADAVGTRTLAERATLVARVLNDFHKGEPMNNENLTIHLKVKDYTAWRTGYDGREKGRVSAGITNGRVFRNTQEPE